ncbi:hypothetical protein ACEPAG_5959 [Sanghuangporus baumii]
MQILEKRVKGYCWKWQQGNCTQGDKCKFRHAHPPPRRESRRDRTSSSISSDPCDTKAPVEPTVRQRPERTDNAIKPPFKNDCLFCTLGLCNNTHRNAASFLLSDTNDPSRICPSRTQLFTRTKPLPSKLPSRPDQLTLTLLKSTRVTFGKGLQVLNVSTAFEPNIVTLGDLPEGISESAVRNIGEPFGELLSIECKQVRSKRSAKLEYAEHTQAALAVASLNGAELFSTKISARLYYPYQDRDDGTLVACRVRVDIPAPGIVAYVGYESLEHAEKIVKTMHGSTYKNHIITVQMHNGIPRLGTFTVKFEGLPFQTTEKNIHGFGGQGKGKPIAGDMMFQKCLYRSLADATNVLQRIFEEYGQLISLDFSRSLPMNGRMRGFARFSRPEGAAAACRALDGRYFAFLGRERIYLQHLHKMVYKIPRRIYDALSAELARLSSFARGQPGVQLSIDQTTPIEIEINASHLDSLKRVKAPLERLIGGETLMEEGKPVWDNFFSTFRGNAFADSVAKQTRTHIRPLGMRCIVRIWGSDNGRAEAKKLLLDELRRRRTARRFALPLSGKVLMKLLFNSLDDIHQKVGEDNASVNLEARQLIIRGTEEQFRWVVRYLSSQSGSISVKRYWDHRPKAGRCPVCLDSLTNAISLDCGHGVCKDCLVRYMLSTNNSRTFPLKCLGDDNRCTELLPLSICQRFLQKEQFVRRAEASFFAYIQMRPQEFHYCPTPDCPQIYRSASGTIRQCPSCLVSICPSCHKVQHDGVECAVTNELGERLFNEWREQHNVKRCPSCSANIEKVAGCNHLTCASCSAHICWECLETFRLSGDVYDHMVRAHGGIGL